MIVNCTIEVPKKLYSIVIKENVGLVIYQE
jgi:hypothetical protein